MKKLSVSLVTPFESLFDNEVASIQLPLWNGYIGIFPDHSSMLAVLGFGPCTFKFEDGTTEVFVVDAGFIEVDRNKVTILASGADKIADIQPEKERAALEATKKIVPRSTEEREFKEDRIRSARARLKLAGQPAS